MWDMQPNMHWKTGRVPGHGGADFDEKCTILTYETSISSAEALEAFRISAKNPELNN